jgi:hypothetical protein
MCICIRSTTPAPSTCSSVYTENKAFWQYFFLSVYQDRKKQEQSRVQRVTQECWHAAVRMREHVGEAIASVSRLHTISLYKQDG